MGRAEWIAGGVVSLGLLVGFGLATACADDNSPRMAKGAGQWQSDQPGVRSAPTYQGDAARSAPSRPVASDRAPGASVGRAVERSRANAPADRAAVTRGTASSRTQVTTDRDAAAVRTREAGRDESITSSRSQSDSRLTNARAGRTTVYERAKALPSKTDAGTTHKPNSDTSATDTARAPRPRAPETFTKADREKALALADRDSAVRSGRTDVRGLDDTKTDAAVTRDAPTTTDIRLPGEPDGNKTGATRTQATWHGRTQGDATTRPTVTEHKGAATRDSSQAASRDSRNHSAGPSDRAVRSTVTARADGPRHFEGERDHADATRARTRDHSTTTVVVGGNTVVRNHTTVIVGHSDRFHHERFRHHPPIFAPVICGGWWWDDWCAPASGFSIGWHSRHWSVWVGDWWPVYRFVVVERVYVAPPVTYYEPIYVPAPRVRIVEPYDRIDRLTDKLSYGTADERQDAARGLGYEDSIRALEPLVDALQYDTDSMVRYEAARSLGKLGFRDALPALHRAAGEDPDEVVQDEAKDSIDAIINY